MEENKGSNNTTISSAQTGPIEDSPKRRRGDDSGEDLLPIMEHFVTLARRVKQPLRLLEMAQRFCSADVLQELIDTARASKAALIPTQ